MQEETFESSGGVKIFLRSWKPAGAAKAVVVICHGFNAHSGLYGWPAEQFAAAGYAVYAMDMRGRGKSEGERFYVDDISEYVDDLSGCIAIAKSREPGLPVFLLGHSAGGVVSCTYAVDHQAELKGFICEDFAFQVPAPGFALSAIKGLAHIAPHPGVLKLPNEAFSRDPAVVKALNEDPLIAHENQPAATVAALVRADEHLKVSFPKITLSVLIIHGTADKATVQHGSEFFYETAGSSDKTLKLYDGYFHDPLADVGKETVMADILAWIAPRVG